MDDRKLDAYGHLNWTVGNEDWFACFDAIRVGQDIRYHVVVNCESGGFIDTMEQGTVRADSAHAIATLKTLPGYWADICRDNYMDERGRRYHVGVRAVARTRKDWARHLDALVKQGPCSEAHPCGQCAECCEDFDPVRDGWVGSDGRP